MTVFQCILMGFLIICAISVSFSKNLLNSILIYMSYSLVLIVVGSSPRTKEQKCFNSSVG